MATLPTSRGRPVVVQTEDLDPEPASWLADRCELIRCSYADAAGLGEVLPRADGLLIRTYTKVRSELLDRAPRLRCVARAGVGVENIDLAACAARGVRVVNTPSANTRAVVEYVLAMLLDATRPRLMLETPVEPARWHELRRELVARKQLSDMTLGIWGLGKIGSQVARVARALEMRVLYYDIREIPPEAAFGAESCGLEDMLRASDAVTVHVDGRAGNRGLVGARAFGFMRPDVLFINTSRGFVVDHPAAAAFFAAHPGATAMLDVHDPHEPLDEDYPLLRPKLANVHLSPHLASGTATAKTNMSWVVRDLWRVLSGQEPEAEVRPGDPAVG